MQNAPRVPGRQFAVGALGGLEGVVARNRDHGGQLALVVLARLARQLEGRNIQFLRAFEVRLGQLDGGERPIPEAGRQLRDREEKLGLLNCHVQPRRKTVSGGSSGSSGNSLRFRWTPIMFSMARRRRSSSPGSS